MEYLIDLFLHLDVHLAEFVAQYGIWVYAGLFAVIFAETGLVVTPFLPGDSLLFAAGALAATGVMDLTLVAASLIAVAAILGDAVNYSIGRAIGPRVFAAQRRRRAPEQAAQPQAPRSRARVLREARRHGRDLEPLRADHPHVRAVRRRRGVDVGIDTFSSTTWSARHSLDRVCVGAGYAFGNVPVVKNNFSIVALGIVAVSLLPMVVEIVRARGGARPKA